MRGLRRSLSQSGSAQCLLDIVSNHIFTDDGFTEEMDCLEHGSIDYVFLEMKREMLLEQAIRETKALVGKTSKQVNMNWCSRCNVQNYYEASTSSNICPQCGLTVFQIENEHLEYSARSRYNRPPKHKYQKKEHFFQTLLDVTCTGRRKISLDIVRYCRCVLGRGKHINFDDVYQALQSGGYTAYYSWKYAIAAQLRGQPEIVLSPREHERVRGEYVRYDRCFHDFQKKHKLANKTLSGGYRLFWPVRFVMAQIFNQIGRADLVISLRKIAGPKRLIKYTKYWDLLTVWVNKREPIKSDCFYKMKLTKLPFRPKRIKYSKTLALQLPQNQPLPSSLSF